MLLVNRGFVWLVVVVIWSCLWETQNGMPCVAAAAAQAQPKDQEQGKHDSLNENERKENVHNQDETPHPQEINTKEQQQTATGEASDRNKNPPVSLAWPIHSQADLSLMSGHDQERYQEFLHSCRLSAAGTLHDDDDKPNPCRRHEAERLAMNRLQPSQMTNFTAAGYAKVTIPPRAWQVLQRVWKQYRASISNRQSKEAAATAEEEDPTESSSSSSLPADMHSSTASLYQIHRREQWEAGSIYTNSWSSPTDMLDIHGILTPTQVRQLEWDVQQVLEPWSGVSLVPTSTYGIRIYRRDSILTPHVDRLPLVISAILHIAHKDNDDDDDTGEWPLQVWGHNGQVQNVTLQPGEMLLYESHSIIHGRPYPLQQEYYANLFLHFEPIGYTYRQEHGQSPPSSVESLPHKKEEESLATKFQRLLQVYSSNSHPPLQQPPRDADIRLPPYLWKNRQDNDNPEDATLQATLERRWKQDYDFVRDYTLKETDNKPKTQVKTKYVYTE